MRSAIAYRVGQAFHGFVAAVAPPDSAPARRVLTPELLELFTRMPAADRAHALAVLSDLEAMGEQDGVLFQAAVLHDAGKAEAGVTVIHRTARVLLAGRAPRIWRWLSSRPAGWRRPFWALAHHPALGADRVARRGGTPDLVSLIRLHEAPTPDEWRDTDQGRRHDLLRRVDARR